MFEHLYCERRVFTVWTANSCHLLLFSSKLGIVKPQVCHFFFVLMNLTLGFALIYQCMVFFVVVEILLLCSLSRPSMFFLFGEKL